MFAKIKKKIKIKKLTKKTNLIAEIALPNAEYVIVNDLVDSLLARFLHLFALLVSLIKHVGRGPIELFLARFLWIVIGRQQRCFLLVTDYSVGKKVKSTTQSSHSPFDIVAVA